MWVNGEEMTENGSGGKDSLTIRDNRTGREYEVDIHEGIRRLGQAI